jgi:hypothetical protein
MNLKIGSPDVCKSSDLGIALIALCVLLFTASCSTSVIVEGSVPVPLVSKMPASVGVVFSPILRNFHHQEDLKEKGLWSVDMGQQNLEFFRTLTQAMFERTAELSEEEVGAVEFSNLDGIIAFDIEKYGFLTPDISGLNFHSASIHYRVSLLDDRNRVLGEWTVVGYGKSDEGTASEALERATEEAIRDGGARIATELPQQPETRAWLAQIAGGDVKVDND